MVFMSAVPARMSIVRRMAPAASGVTGERKPPASTPSASRSASLSHESRESPTGTMAGDVRSPQPLLQYVNEFVGDEPPPCRTAGSVLPFTEEDVAAPRKGEDLEHRHKAAAAGPE